MGAPNTLQRVMRRVTITAGCWVWTGARQPRGYGTMRAGGRHWLVHRYIYTNTVGPIPDGHELDHLCRNTTCVRPSHLEPVPHVVNVRRGDAGRNQLERTHCPKGHPYDEGNTRRSKGQRTCRACAREYSRRYREARR